LDSATGLPRNYFTLVTWPSTFADSDLTPFNKFPINDYDLDDPVDSDSWTQTVTGAVQKPEDYTLAEIPALPRFRQNSRHICVEGWDVIGRFGGTRLSDFLGRLERI
jgi:DMSO/TMAO reductase YedYZ molybdopterin-dependent catalytic subunit